MAEKKKKKKVKVTSEDLLRMWPFGVKEYSFHPERGWRFDWALPEFQIAFELDGFTYHTVRSEWDKDREKFNEAHLLGWKVFHITPDEFRRGDADWLMQRVLGKYVKVKR